MSKTSIIVGLTGVAFVTSLAAQEIVAKVDVADAAVVKGIWPAEGAKVVQDPERGAVLKLPEKGMFVFPQLHKIDTSKDFTLRASFRTADPTKQTVMFFGLAFYDEEEFLMTPYTVRVVPNTESALAMDAKPGDTTVHIEKGEWHAGLDSAVALDADPGLADLPNRNVHQVSEVVDEGEMLALRLEFPVQTEFPQGTPVRQHQNILYSGEIPTIYPAWEEFEFRISGVSPPGEPDRAQFWHRTDAVRILILTGIAGAEPTAILVDNLKLTSP